MPGSVEDESKKEWSDPIPIKDVMADPLHPWHEVMKEMLRKLENGEIHLS